MKRLVRWLTLTKEIKNMAIVKANQNQTDNEDKNKPVVVDWSNVNALPKGKKSKLDPTEDAWEMSAPPPKGDYDLKLFVSGNSGWTILNREPNDDDTAFYSCNMECRIVSEDKDIDNYPVFGTVTTRIGRGKNISTMAAMIRKCGFKCPDEATDLEVAQVFRKVLAKEPILHGCELDWQGWSKEDKKVVFMGMDDFPEDSEGNKKFRVVRTANSGVREEIVAQLKVKTWGDAKVGNLKKKGNKEEDSEEDVVIKKDKGKEKIKPIVRGEVEEDVEEEKVEVEEKASKKDKAGKKDKVKPVPVAEADPDEDDIDDDDDLEAAEDDE